MSIYHFHPNHNQVIAPNGNIHPYHHIPRTGSSHHLSTPHQPTPQPVHQVVHPSHQYHRITQPYYQRRRSVPITGLHQPCFYTQTRSRSGSFFLATENSQPVQQLTTRSNSLYGPAPPSQSPCVGRPWAQPPKQDSFYGPGNPTHNPPNQLNLDIPRCGSFYEKNNEEERHFSDKATQTDMSKEIIKDTDSCSTNTTTSTSTSKTKTETDLTRDPYIMRFLFPEYRDYWYTIPF